MAFLSNSIKKVFLFALVVCCYNFATAQLKATTIGDASSLGNNCFQITPDLRGQAGGVWFDHPIDFSSDFIIAYQAYFGKDDSGADGMGLVFKGTPEAEIGSAAGGMGYRGISPSLTLEFDTYYNPTSGDIKEDHIALIENGVTDHRLPSNLAGPVSAVLSTDGNIEDDTWHDVKIEWIASIQTINVYFDCVLRLSKRQDFKSSIFNNDNTVYFGFVGGTGGATNLQEVCLNRISFIDDLIASDEIICSSKAIEKDVSLSNGVTYSWLPISGVSNPSSSKPILSPNVTTEYTVTITDQCGEIFNELINITVLPVVTPTFDFINDVCGANTVSVLPTESNEGIKGEWSPEIDTSKTTTYTFIPNIDECAEQITVTITIPTFDIINGVCEGVLIDPLATTSIEGIKGLWSPIINNNISTTYTFTPNSDECAQSITKRIEVYSIEPLELSTIISPDSFSENRTIELYVTGGSGFYEYQLDGGIWQSKSVFEKVSRCSQHDVAVRDIYACTTEIKGTVDLIFYPKFFTPNGDGYHEFWNIQCLEADPEAVVFIYNRHGALLKQIKPNQNGWDGTYRGTQLPTGGYWFVAHYKGENNENKELRGYFALKR
ncbi:lectin-like domain-containing protein [Algibacter lectus]|uniref:lectin-like domain-containing protein n=1 Tax=Algibacter lectus TaxID=221126 RepID=UPI0026E94954|nr:T9SS type B sorting domain-containing protein [Algibacter lectus]MDO7138856.1 T9SS type B sorting domain-containing protein [Algibacter lectus]